jgi:uncharacterized protein
MVGNELLKAGTSCEFYVKGMHCAACELVIEQKLSKSKLIKKVNAVLNKKRVYFEIENPIEKDKLLKEINLIINKNGYELIEESEEHKVKYNELGLGLAIALLVIAIFLILQKLGIANILGGKDLSLPVVLLIGIVASLSSCMAVVGGLVLSISSSYAKSKDKVKPLIFFHFSRIASFFILGGIIGLIGSAFSLTPTFYFVMSVILFIIMLILGINLLDIFPGFQKFQVRMPKVLTRSTITNETIQSNFTPVILGAITFFLPCGFTQAMQFNAIASGSIIQGALIMAVFALGTFPILSLISFSSVKLSESMNSGIFFKTAGFIVLFFAGFNFLSSLVAAGIIAPIF